MIPYLISQSHREIQLKTAFGLFVPNVIANFIRMNKPPEAEKGMSANHAKKMLIRNYVTEGKTNPEIRKIVNYDGLKRSEQKVITRLIFVARRATGIGLSAEATKKRNAILSDHDAGMSISEIRIKYKYSTDKSAADALMQFGVDLAGEKRERYKERDKEIVKMWYQNEDMKPIMKKLKMRKAAVYQVLWREIFSKKDAAA